MLLLMSVLFAGPALAQAPGLTPGDSVTVYRPLNGVAEYRDRHGNRTTVYDQGYGVSRYHTHPSAASREQPRSGQIYEPFAPAPQSRIGTPYGNLDRR